MLSGQEPIANESVEDVLQEIQQDFAFVTKDDCVPVQIALQFMDASSLGRAHQYDQFRDVQKHLQRALKAIVNGKTSFQGHVAYPLILSRASPRFQQLDRNFP